MSRVLGKQEIKEVLYGATLLGGGGGGPLQIALDVLEPMSEDEAKLMIYDLEELEPDDYGVMVATLGSPVAMNSAGAEVVLGEAEKYAVEGIVKELKKDGKHIKFMYSGEYGGLNTFMPILTAINLRMPFVDVDGEGRAVPELNTGLQAIYGIPTSPMVLSNSQGDVMVAYTKDPMDDKAAEKIARQMCMAYDMRIGFSTWVVSKEQMKNLVPGAISKAAQVGKSILASKKANVDPIQALSKVVEIRELFRGEVMEVQLVAENGFDFGITTFKSAEGKRFFIDFKNENLVARDDSGNVLMVVPEIICLLDMDSYEPLTNAEIKVGMNVSVIASPAAENWWKIPEGFTCWNKNLELVGYNGGPVRF